MSNINLNKVFDKEAIDILYWQVQEQDLILEVKKNVKNVDANISNIAFLKLDGAVITTF